METGKKRLTFTPSQIGRVIGRMGLKPPDVVETDSLFALNEWGDRLFYRWEAPMSYSLPALLWNRTDGMMEVVEAVAEGASHRGQVRKVMGYPYLIRFLIDCMGSWDSMLLKKAMHEEGVRGAEPVDAIEITKANDEHVTMLLDVFGGRIVE